MVFRFHWIANVAFPKLPGQECRRCPPAVALSHCAPLTLWSGTGSILPLEPTRMFSKWSWSSNGWQKTTFKSLPVKNCVGVLQLSCGRTGRRRPFGVSRTPFLPLVPRKVDQCLWQPIRVVLKVLWGKKCRLVLSSGRGRATRWLLVGMAPSHLFLTKESRSTYDLWCMKINALSQIEYPRKPPDKLSSFYIWDEKRIWSIVRSDVVKVSYLTINKVSSLHTSLLQV